MKRTRYLFIILMSALFLHAEAGDTLTRAQVYNFNVGDTFDYRNYNALIYGGNSGWVPVGQINYSRYIVTNIYWSLDSQTKYIVRTQVHPLPAILDTLVLTNLQGYEVIMDADSEQSWGAWVDTCIVSGEPNFFGNEMNSLSISYVGTGGFETKFFARGLGAVITNDYCYGLPSRYNDSVVLIYHSGDSGTYGMPYTAFHDTTVGFPAGVTNMLSNENIRIYPTLNNGTFTIDAGDGTMLPLEFGIYDVQGRKSLQVIINGKTSIVHADGLSSGLYIWNISFDGHPLQNGKMVITK